MKTIEQKRMEVCADIYYFGYGSLCNDKDPCDACRKILGMPFYNRKKDFSRTIGKNFEKDRKEFEESTKGLKRVPHKRLHLPIR